MMNIQLYQQFWCSSGYQGEPTPYLRSLARSGLQPKAPLRPSPAGHATYPELISVGCRNADIFSAASPAKASKAHYCTPGWWNGGWSWLDCCDGQHLSRARILISDVIWLSFSAATHHQMGKLYPLSEPSVCRFGKPAFTNWEAFTNGESQTHSSMGPATLPLDVALRPEVEAKANASVIRWKSIVTARVILTTSPRKAGSTIPGIPWVYSWVSHSRRKELGLESWLRLDVALSCVTCNKIGQSTDWIPQWNCPYAMQLKISIWPFKVASFAVCWHSKDHMSHWRIYPTSRNTLLVLLRANLGNTCSVWRSLKSHHCCKQIRCAKAVLGSWHFYNQENSKRWPAGQSNGVWFDGLPGFQFSETVSFDDLFETATSCTKPTKADFPSISRWFWHPGTTISIAPPGPPRFARSSHRSRCSAEATSGHVWGKLPGIAC